MFNPRKNPMGKTLTMTKQKKLTAWAVVDKYWDIVRVFLHRAVADEFMECSEFGAKVIKIHITYPIE